MDVTNQKTILSIQMMSKWISRTGSFELVCLLIKRNANVCFISGIKTLNWFLDLFSTGNMQFMQYVVMLRSSAGWDQARQHKESSTLPFWLEFLGNSISVAWQVDSLAAWQWMPLVVTCHVRDVYPCRVFLQLTSHKDTTIWIHCQTASLSVYQNWISQKL